jgi:hypothetical protein
LHKTGSLPGVRFSFATIANGLFDVQKILSRLARDPSNDSMERHSLGSRSREDVQSFSYTAVFAPIPSRNASRRAANKIQGIQDLDFLRASACMGSVAHGIAFMISSRFI